MASPLDYLGTPQASTTVIGKSRLATIAETTAGTSQSLACTPAGVAAVAIAGAPDASTTVKGIIEIATDSEAVAKTSGTLAIVPSNIPDIMAAPGDIGGVTPGAGTFTTLTATTLVFSSALDVAEGGTGLSSITDHGIMVGSGTGAVTPLAVGTNNQVLIGQTGADPIWTTNVDLPGTLDVTGAVVLDDALTVAGAATVSGLLTGSASATIETAGAALNLGIDNSADAIKLGGGTSARAITIGQDAAAHTVAIGQAAAGAITVDTAAGISLDAATASNFTVTGASADLTLRSAGGSVNITATENAANAIFIQADGGTSETIVINVDQGTGVASLELSSDVGGVTVSAGLASADAINLAASAGGIDMDGALQINVASSQAAATAIQLTASDAAGGITLTAGTGNVNVAGNLSFSTSGNKILSANVGTTTAAGANSFGSVTLTAGTATVATTSVTTNSLVIVWRQSPGATGAAAIGEISLGTITNGTSFVINALDQTDATAVVATDVSVCGYMIIN